MPPDPSFLSGPPDPGPAESGAPAAGWPDRWAQLARAFDVPADAPLLVALSGGADSVLLLHLVAEARPRPPVRAVHVNHGLRGQESDADAAFCAELCARLDVPLTVCPVPVVPGPPSLEARARTARYRALFEQARLSGHTTVLTGHHADDALETLLMRWMRGTSLAGLAGLKRKFVVTGRTLNDESAAPREGTGQGAGAEDDREADHPLDPVTVVRPLVTMRREEVRSLLASRDIAWREDSSNADPAHTRNRVRNELLPLVSDICGEEGIESLRAFSHAVDDFEQQLAAETAHLDWSAPPHARASRGPDLARLGGTIARSRLARLPSHLSRRVLWRLLTEGTGRSPGRVLLDRVHADLARGRCSRHSLPGAWTLVLRSAQLLLIPPAGTLRRAQVAAGSRASQGLLPFPESDVLPVAEAGSAPPADSDRDARETLLPRPPRWVDTRTLGLDLRLPGVVDLPDGRRISARLARLSPAATVPQLPEDVELDAEDLPERLTVRWPREGERFHPLGAPGSKSLLRFLADAGIPREERGAVPVVCADDELLWVVGVRPSERRRVGPRTRVRLQLSVHG